METAFRFMNESEQDNSAKSNRNFLGYGYALLALISAAAITATFFTAASALDFAHKKAVFLTIVLVYPALFFPVYVWQNRRVKNLYSQIKSPEEVFNAEIENKLLALEEASEFFGASLKPADMFRLVASRINELVPFTACALFLANESGTKLKITMAAGDGAADLKNLETDAQTGLAGKTFQTRQPQLDEKLAADKNIYTPESVLKNFGCGVATPLLSGAEAFGVLVLYGGAAETFDANSVRLLESIGERVTLLFLSSLAFERNVESALTDALTDLPNERAFYLVLENQIAESQRQREERPLTILTLDVKNFADLNDKYGYGIGDDVLTFVSDTLKQQLRQMDFLARAASDEFLIVLPTATSETAAEIVARIERAFAAKAFEISRGEKKYLQLNFGVATFLRDGETAGQLLQVAHLRKQQLKSPGKSSLLLFPKEYVN